MSLEPIHVKFSLGPNGSDCKIEVDGRDISGHTKTVLIEADAEGATQVLIVLNNVDVEIEGVTKEIGLYRSLSSRIDEVLLDHPLPYIPGTEGLRTYQDELAATRRKLNLGPSATEEELIAEIDALRLWTRSTQSAPIPDGTIMPGEPASVYLRSKRSGPSRSDEELRQMASAELQRRAEEPSEIKDKSRPDAVCHACGWPIGACTCGP